MSIVTAPTAQQSGSHPQCGTIALTFVKLPRSILIDRQLIFDYPTTRFRIPK